jgi:inosose dehydratase
VGAFLPQHLSRSDVAAEDRDWLRDQLRLLDAATPPGATRPFAVLCEAIDEPDRLRWSGRIARHPEAQLDGERWRTLADNLHRAADLCLEEGIEPVIHPHAGTYLETDDEIERLVERMDASLIGLCLDTGHFRYGGATPARRVHDYRSVVRHVHIKDCRTSVLAEVDAEDGDLPMALARGVFCPLGEGDADIPGVVAALREVDYAGWLVIEQDQALTASVTRAALVDGQRRNLAYLRGLGA